jgi:hypothetical protein
LILILLLLYVVVMDLVMIILWIKDLLKLFLWRHCILITNVFLAEICIESPLRHLHKRFLSELFIDMLLIGVVKDYRSDLFNMLL